MDDNIVLMYGCPIVEWKPIEEIKPIETPIKDINYFKEKFEELFSELELFMGECKSVEIKRSDDCITTEIKF